MWWGDVAHDQRPTDAFSLVYDSAPLTADLEILGLPRALLRVSADAPRANWFARISDVAPDGTVTQVAGAGFNGNHRRSARAPELLTPGEEFPLDIEMHFTSWVFPQGHRIRVAVNNSQWPMLWPSPHPMTTTLAIGGADGARVILPVVPKAARPAPAFLPPESSPALAGFEPIDNGTPSGYGEISEVRRNPQTGTVVAVATNAGAERHPWGIDRYAERIEHSTSEAHPENTSMTGTHRMEVDLPEPQAAVGGGPGVSQRPHRVRLRVCPARVRERQAAAGKALDPALSARSLTEPAGSISAAGRVRRTPAGPRTASAAPWCPRSPRGVDR